MESESNYPHHAASGLGVYEGKPFVTGSFSPAHKKTEILDYGNQWNTVADYPFNSGNMLVSNSFEIIFIWFSRICAWATTTTGDGLYILGGWVGNAGRSSIIAKYKNDQWYNVGNLNTLRSNHGVITSGSSTLVIGGNANFTPGKPYVVKIKNLIVFK